MSAIAVPVALATPPAHQDVAFLVLVVTKLQGGQAGFARSPAGGAQDQDLRDRDHRATQVDRVGGQQRGNGLGVGLPDDHGQRLQQQLGIDHVHANTLDIVDGKLTGRVLGEIVDGQRKAALLRQIAAQENISLEQTIAVGDGANDLPMLSIAGLGIAFRAKPVVRAAARQSLSTMGLDGILYLMGLSDRETV